MHSKARVCVCDCEYARASEQFGGGRGARESGWYGGRIKVCWILETQPVKVGDLQDVGKDALGKLRRSPDKRTLILNEPRRGGPAPVLFVICKLKRGKVYNEKPILHVCQGRSLHHIEFQYDHYRYRQHISTIKISLVGSSQ